MNEESFEKIDGFWRNRLKDLRQKRVAPQLLKGFSASVEARLREKEGLPVEPRPARSGWAFGFRPLVPVFAVLVIASALVLRYPLWQRTILESTKQPVPMTAMVTVAAAVSDVTDDIAALKALGAWTEEDEALVGNPEENALTDLELVNTTGG